MKKVYRKILRGKPLDIDCKIYAYPISEEYGPKDKRCFCSGIWDLSVDDFLYKCYKCSAFVKNEYPEIDKG